MIVKTIDASMLKKMFLAGAAGIDAQKDYINELNVFPVPDGDTGTNMTLTIMSAVKEVNSLEDLTIEGLAKAISSGSLRGARGNSGVILSQLFRGFTKEIRNHEKLDVVVLANAFQRASDTAYKAVMKPKEGTILTVARGGAEKAIELATQTEDLVYFGTEVLKYMDEVLEDTPNLLPVLKEAGVVDSGGQGLLEFVKGAFDAFLGKEIDLATVTSQKSIKAGGTGIKLDKVNEMNIEFGYCTEFIIMLENVNNNKVEKELKTYLTSLGDSLVVVSDEDIVKVHVHTNDPGLAIQKALTFGSLTSMKIDNMREEHNEKLIKDAANYAKATEIKKEPEKKTAKKPFGFLSVSMGDGLSDIFKGLGVDYLIEGGQTMNPSTEDMLEAIDKVNAKTIYILPNNGNIILAAEQAKALTKDKEIIVIPSKTVPQGITAIINFVHDKSAKENAKRMTEEMSNVKTGQVTYAVRDTSIDGKSIKQGNIMGIDDKTIQSVGTDVKATTLDLIKGLVDEESELISLYYGAETKEEDAAELAKELEAEYPEIDIEVHYGGQPIYYYVLSVE
ncbi:MAG TPA: DAK2 domain-containing protein [Clostridiales bacterium]|nr:DAK2 domain-containing protein [Clostridiales bacterium]